MAGILNKAKKVINTLYYLTIIHHISPTMQLAAEVDVNMVNQRTLVIFHHRNLEKPNQILYQNNLQYSEFQGDGFRNA